MPKPKKKKTKKVGLSPVVATVADASAPLTPAARDDEDRDVFNLCWNDDWIDDAVTFKQFKAGTNALFLFHLRQYPSDDARQLDINLFATDIDAKLVFLGYSRKINNPALARGALAGVVQAKADPLTELLDVVEQQYAPPQG